MKTWVRFLGAPKLKPLYHTLQPTRKRKAGGGQGIPTCWSSPLQSVFVPTHQREMCLGASWLLETTHSCLGRLLPPLSW
jgi:hypothetical protein